jgi:hypothetical protein
MNSWPQDTEEGRPWQTSDGEAAGETSAGNSPVTREASRKLRKLRRQAKAQEMVGDAEADGEVIAVKGSTEKEAIRNPRKLGRQGKVPAIELAHDVQAEGEIASSRILSAAEEASRKELRKAGLSRNAIRKATRYGGVQAPVEPTIRKIGEKKEVYSSGPKIHYSAPLIPVARRESKPATKSNVKSSVYTTEKKETEKKETEKKENDKEKRKDDWTPPSREHWMLDKAALKKKFPEGWKPLKKLSPDALAGIRALHAQDPIQYNTEVLSNSFQVSPEAMRRILKSKWSPSADEETERQRRWQNRGKSIYKRYVELGVLKPPRKWREMGIGSGKPEWMVKRGEARKRGQAALPALVVEGRARDQKRGMAARREEERKRRRAPLPMLTTTKRVSDEKMGSLEDSIL